MARKTAGMNRVRWAEDGERMTPEQMNVSRDNGLGVEFSQLGGRNVPRELFNQLMREKTGCMYSFNRFGSISEWSAEIDYWHTNTASAFVIGSNGRLYVSLSGSGPATNDATDPTQAGQTKWKVY